MMSNFALEGGEILRLLIGQVGEGKAGGAGFFVVDSEDSPLVVAGGGGTSQGAQGAGSGAGGFSAGGGSGSGSQWGSG